MDTSVQCRDLFSEEAKRLKEFTLQLESADSEKADTAATLRDIEEFLFCEKNRRAFKADDISRN